MIRITFLLIFFISILIGNNCKEGFNGDPYNKTIDCSFNNLTQLNKKWLQLKSTKYKLDLSFNKLKDVNNLKNLKSVFILYLDGNNNLQNISGLNNITYLHLLYLDKKNYRKKLSKESWLCNGGLSHIYLTTNDGDLNIIDSSNKKLICEE